LKKTFSFQKVSKLFITPILLVLIQSCTNIPIGQELSNSFDSPSEMNLPVDKVSQGDNPLTSNITKKKVEKSPSFKANRNKPRVVKKTSIIGNLKQNKPKKQVSNFIPQPYRITIKLSASNPSAPAETVTKALRNAGVSFEVEMIERIDPQSLIEERGSVRSKR